MPTKVTPNGIEEHPLASVLEILQEQAPRICQECEHFGDCVAGLRKFCEASVKPKSEAADGGDRQQPLATPAKGPPAMDTPQHNHDYHNGQSRIGPSHFLADIVNQIKVGWVTAIIVISFVTNIIVHLLVSGWLIAPARSTDLNDLTKAVAILAKSVEPMPANLIRIETSLQSLAHQYDSTDRKLDVLIGRPAAQQQTRYIVKKSGLFGH